ncbi:GMC family oxidoreductase [Flavihumibacter sp. R14]|nr:GMC family oxidoreductase [Flavihumibacter soli]
MNKLSRPITNLKPEYDVVVIGSGYGGSIAASRFSRAGLKVCLLEKGKEFQPGDYPATMGEAEKEMQINADQREARKNGLYDLHISENISVFKGCGLGGTSLVNANVSIEPEERVLLDERWPAAIRNDRQSLNEGFERAKEMLRPMPYPVNKNGYPELAKARAMRLAAEKNNQPFRYADINVCFETGINHVGVYQHQCINCGDCVTGCNHHAKNTLIMNYLPDAVNHDAEIFCNIDVKHVERSGGKWVVNFEVFNTSREDFKAPYMFVRAATVIVAGGALGSTEILLRSKQEGLEISPTLGQRFTGNGDVLGFAYNCEDEINGIGLGKLCNEEHYKPIAPVGPCITTIIDLRNQDKLEDGMTFEEGSIPGPIANAINTSMLSLAGSIGIDTDGGFSDWLKECSEEAESLIRGPYHGATNRMETFLVMSHDDGQGRLNLKNGRLNIDWPDVGKQPIFQKVSDTMLKATTALGGKYIKNLVWNKLMNYDLITVHPLGGCCMAEDAASGVTDDTGNVFFGESGTATHPGLHVLDGAILPRPLGTNPLLTISALTERACKLILQRMNREITYDLPVVIAKEFQPKPTVQFTETMRGYFSTDEKEDFESGYKKGKETCSPFMFTLTVQAEDIDNFVNDETHTGFMAGTVIAPALSQKPLTISKGIFNLFVQDPDDPTHKKMKYSMQLNTYDGRQYYFYAYKQVEHDKAFDLWKDTTVLYITVFDGSDNSAPVLGRGILKIIPIDFATQMGTIKALHTKSKLQSLLAIKAFSTFFSNNVVETYFSKFFNND